MSKQPAKSKTTVHEAEPAEVNAAPANGPTANEIDELGGKWVADTVTPEPETVKWDTSPCDQPELVPDPPGYGKYDLLVSVDFTNENGKEVHIDAGVINGSDLPEAFAAELTERGQLLVKK